VRLVPAPRPATPAPRAAAPAPPPSARSTHDLGRPAPSAAAAPSAFPEARVAPLAPAAGARRSADPSIHALRAASAGMERDRLRNVERQVLSLRRRAKVLGAFFAAAGVTLVVAAATQNDQMLGTMVVCDLGLVGSVFAAIPAARRVRRSGVRVRQALGRGWKEAVARLDPRSRSTLLAEHAGSLVSSEVLASQYGAAVRRAVEDRAAIIEIVDQLGPADRTMIPDVLPTVESLVERIASLATSMHHLDLDSPDHLLPALERRIAEAERVAVDAPDRERRITLLQRQRATLQDLVQRRGAIAAQLENATLLLQNVRLDLLKLRSSGLDAALTDLATATQEARALSRDIGHAVDAAGEIRR
jgi:serine/threonine-protein kinase